MKFILILTTVLLPLLAQAANPIITDIFTADPAAMVYKDTKKVALAPGDRRAELRSMMPLSEPPLCIQ